MKVFYISLALPLLILLLAEPASSNFFSRILKVGSDDTKSNKKPAPSGATKNMGSEAQVGSVITFEDGVPLAALANNNRIPLVGIGVGNMEHNRIAGMVAAAIQPNKKSRLIDTARASQNEHLVADGIVRGVEKLNPTEPLEVHVVTKLWYTHLGYERSKVAVQETMEAFQAAIEHPKVNLKIHYLIHWPKCYDNIPWMNCKEDELQTPEKIRNAGPDPTQNPNAWKESWKLLEDVYLSEQYPIASIGVSNFHLHELEVLTSFARIHPHVLQISLWSILYDAMLIEYCHKHRIHVQGYNILSSTVARPEHAPKAFRHIQKVAQDISKEVNFDLTPAQVILSWLIQHGVSVVPRTTKVDRLEADSGVVLSQVPAFNDHQVEMIAHAVEAYLSGQDLEQDLHVTVTFHAVNRDIFVYWMGHDGNEVQVQYLQQGESYEETTYPNHTFRIYNALDKDQFFDHVVDADFGEHKHVHVEL